MWLLAANIDPNFFAPREVGESWTDYIWFGSFIAAAILLKRPITLMFARLSNIIVRFFVKYEHHKQELGHMIYDPLERMLQVILLFAAFNRISWLTDRITWHSFLKKKGDLIYLDEVLSYCLLFLFIVFLAQLVSAFISFLYGVYIEKARAEDNKHKAQILPLITEIGKLLIWVIASFWILGSVFQVNVPALITGLGIGGVAIALAAKENIESIFASFTILSDKNFEIGDTIRFGGTEGVVERIGFRSTRIRTTDGAAHIIPNQKLVNETIANLSKRDTRIVKVPVQVKYGVKQADLEKMIRELKEKLPGAPYVKEPTDVLMDSFNKNTAVLNVTYCLPHPLPPEITVDQAKMNVNMLIYGVLNSYDAFYIPAIIEEEDKPPSEQ